MVCGSGAPTRSAQTASIVPRFTATPSKTLSKSAVVQVYPSACRGRWSESVLKACCKTSCSVSSGVSYGIGWPSWDCLLAPTILPGGSQPAHLSGLPLSHAPKFRTTESSNNCRGRLPCLPNFRATTEGCPYKMRSAISGQLSSFLHRSKPHRQQASVLGEVD